VISLVIKQKWYFNALKAKTRPFLTPNQATKTEDGE